MVNRRQHIFLHRGKGRLECQTITYATRFAKIWILWNRFEDLWYTFSREGTYTVTTRYCMQTWQSKTYISIQVSACGSYINNRDLLDVPETMKSLSPWRFEKSMPVLQRVYLRIGSHFRVCLFLMNPRTNPLSQQHCWQWSNDINFGGVGR